MRVTEPRQFKHLKPVKQKKSKKRFIFILLILGLFVLGYVRFNQKLPDYEYSLNYNLKPGTKLKLEWPASEQAAVGIIGRGVIASNNSEKAVPIASTAKIITALMVLNKKPLKLNEDGPVIQITEQDQQIYDKYYLIQGSRVEVSPGYNLTEKQALQAMLIPSANNIAETLTNWAFGSQEEFLKYTNKYIESLNLKNTKITDSSGFSPDTVSTANELAVIVDKAIQNPVIAEIVAQKQAYIPFAGMVSNTNWLLGKNGVNGVKTGHTDQSGGCFIVSADAVLSDKTNKKIFGVILGSSDVDQAIVDVQPIVLEQLLTGYKNIQVITKGQKLGSVTTKWGEKSLLFADKDLELFGWQEDQPKIQIQMKKNLKNLIFKGKILGEANVNLDNSNGKVNIVLGNEIKPPNFWWKFKRIFQ